MHVRGRERERWRRVTPPNKEKTETCTNDESLISGQERIFSFHLSLSLTFSSPIRLALSRVCLLAALLSPSFSPPCFLSISVSRFLAAFLSFSLNLASCQMSILAFAPSSSPSVSHLLHFTFTVSLSTTPFFSCLDISVLFLHQSPGACWCFPPYRCCEGMNTDICCCVLPSLPAPSDPFSLRGLGFQGIVVVYNFVETVRLPAGSFQASLLSLSLFPRVQISRLSFFIFAACNIYTRFVLWLISIWLPEPPSTYTHFSKYFSFNNSCRHLNFTRLPFLWGNLWQRRLIQDTTLNFVRWNIALVWYFGPRHRRCSCYLLFQTTQIVSPNLICSLPDNGGPYWSDWFSLICERVGSQTILTGHPLTVRKKFLFCLSGLNPNAITPFNFSEANKLCGFWSYWLCCVHRFKRHVYPETTPHCSQWFFV